MEKRGGKKLRDVSTLEPVGQTMSDTLTDTLSLLSQCFQDHDCISPPLNKLYFCICTDEHWWEMAILPVHLAVTVVESITKSLKEDIYKIYFISR